MAFLPIFTVLMLPVTLGDDSQPMKVMFFGDSLISGVHNKEASVCPFRYDFLRGLKKRGKEVIVVGTNSDNEGACQKVGEELSLTHNGYLNAEIDELLDFIAVDLQYLYDPVDYVFTSIGLQDCLHVAEGSDFQIVSQSVRRIMGRLLNLNENGKIYHVPIMIPPSAGKTAIECMDFVNQKLRDVYDPEKNHGRIRVMDPLKGQTLTEDMFYKLGEKKVVTKPASAAAPTTPAAPAASVVDTLPAGDQGAVPTRRLARPLEYLPKPELTRKIANVLLSDLDWSFRAQTPPPTKEVTKEPDYYGYDWCKDAYDEEECFEYYYGYVWCLQEYSEEDCYNYYYGEVEEWEEEDSYKWCLNFYDEEYCSFAYHGEEPDTWDWLSVGYHDCLKTNDNNQCFELYYGYAWCVNEYTSQDCYEYYYGDEQWEWDTDSSMKWCRNFYTEDECTLRYAVSGTSTSRSSSEGTSGSMTNTIRVVAFLIVIGLGIWFYYKKTTKSGYRKIDKATDAEDVEQMGA